MSELRFDGRVAVITGSGGGLGREYALLFASRGASVVVNDLGGTRSGEGQSSKSADLVVSEIRSKGGKAVANYDSVEEGDKIIKTAIDNFGRVDIIVNNAGILRDKSFQKTTQEDWDLIHKVHLRGAFVVTKAAWPYLRDQSYGRIIMTASSAGIYGNFGQSNYSAAKIGLLGLSNTLSIEGSKYNIHCNTIVPVAGSRLTEDILPENLFNQLKPCFVAPIVVWLSHETCPDTGGCFEAAGGWVGKYRWQRSLGKAFIPPEKLTIESVRDNWQQITTMEGGSFPANVHEQMGLLVNSLSGESAAAAASYAQQSPKDDNNTHRFTPDDVILYALGVGASIRDVENMRFLYENNEEFTALPTYGVIPCLNALVDIDLIGAALKPLGIDFNLAKMLHGEQYLELKRPIPTSGVFTSKVRTVDVLDKGSGALLILEADTFDENNEPVCYNQFALFLIGGGNFGGKKLSSDPRVKQIAEPPKRNPDATVYEKTSIDQAALYRLTGDKNPMHIDPSFAALGGFNEPILHGLCSLGYATRHVLGQYAGNDSKLFKAVKARFAGTVIPGQTIQTDMWRDGNRIHFHSICKETGKPVIAGAYIDLNEVRVSLPKADVNQAFEELEDDGVLTDVVFEEIARRVQMAPELSKKINGIFEFIITKDKKEVRVWTVDFKVMPGQLYAGHCKTGSADCVIKISDQDMTALACGEMDPVRAFMTGKLKIRGNLMATQRLQALFELNSAELYDKDVVAAPENAPKMELSPGLSEGFGNLHKLITSGGYGESRGYRREMTDPITDYDDQKWSAASYEGDEPIRMVAAPYDDSQEESAPFMFAAGAGSGDGPTGEKCRIDRIFESWIANEKRMAEFKELIPTIKTVYQWNILKGGKVASVWTCDFKNGDGLIHAGPPKTGKADCTLAMEDDFCVRIFEGKEDAMKAFMSGKLKITGNILAAQKLQQLWADEADNVRESLKEVTSDSAPTAAAPAPAANDDVDPDIEDIPCTGIKGDIFFRVFQNRCHEEPDFMQRLRVAFQFNITKDGKPMCIWTADNKTTSEITIYRSVAKNIKPDVVATVEDDDLLKILTGRVNPQRLFMMGRVKVKGNIMLLQKLNSLWAEFQKLGRSPELPLIVDVMLEDPMIPGLKSESIVVDLIQRLVKCPEVFKEAAGYHQFIITKDGKVVSTWTLDLKDAKNFHRGPPKNGKPTSTMTVDDVDFARLVLMKFTLSDGIARGLIKIEGNQNLAMKLNKLYTTPTSLKPRL